MIAILILSFVALFAIAVSVAYLSHRKKSATGELRLIGMPVIATTQLNPEGAILVQGELWRARSANGKSIRPESVLCVIGSFGHLLLVDSDSQ